MLANMVMRRHPMSCLLALADELAIEIAGHLAATSERLMDDIRSPWATCSSMAASVATPLLVGAWH